MSIAADQRLNALEEKIKALETTGRFAQNTDDGAILSYIRSLEDRIKDLESYRNRQQAQVSRRGK